MKNPTWIIEIPLTHTSKRYGIMRAIEEGIHKDVIAKEDFDTDMCHFVGFSARSIGPSTIVR